MSRRISVRLFARLRELTGADVVELDVSVATTAGDIRRTIARRWPAAGALATTSAVAINSEYAEDDRVIRDDDEVALVPPVSGGQ